MKRTKENTLKVLKAMTESAATISKDFEETNSEMSKIYLERSMAIDDVIELLTNNEYFTRMFELYCN